MSDDGLQETWGRAASCCKLPETFDKRGVYPILMLCFFALINIGTVTFKLKKSYLRWSLTNTDLTERVRM